MYGMGKVCEDSYSNLKSRPVKKLVCVTLYVLQYLISVCHETIDLPDEIIQIHEMEQRMGIAQIKHATVCATENVIHIGYSS